MSSLQKNFARVASIDVIRGLAMVIMAIDHVRDYVHIQAGTGDPLNLETTTPALFFTRYITHFCAPVFVFLSGTSIYLQSLRKTPSELAGFLIKRGIWLILAEAVIISFGWFFNPHFNFIFFQVIWAIGICMVLLGLLIRLPYWFIVAMGFCIVLGHNLLDTMEAAPGFNGGIGWELLHRSPFEPHTSASGFSLLIGYPFLPWLGVMMLGYGAGRWFTTAYSTLQRRKYLCLTGVAALVLFVVLRYTNSYGNPWPWEVQTKSLYTFFSFMDVNKYPPSLLFCCITLGPALILLSAVEPVSNRVTRFLSVFGRVPFFYYILHLYLIHGIATILFFARGHQLAEALAPDSFMPFYFVVPREGFGLVGVYTVWLLVIAILYFPCRWYDRYKTQHKEKWWLSYL